MEKDAPVPNIAADVPSKKKALMHEFKGEKENFMTRGLLIILFIGALAGIVTGYMVSSANGGYRTVKKSASELTASDIEKGATYGSSDESTFKDAAEGTLREGGIEGEGAFHLERPGGESQNVYLTSSVIDLSQFIGRKVKVWGETNAAKRAGWLMDVGRLQVLE